MALEMSRPLNFVGSQAMHFLTPFLSVFTNTQGYQQLAEFLEQRGSIDTICIAIENRQQISEQATPQNAIGDGVPSETD
jgi:hypothetical protein